MSLRPLALFVLASLVLAKADPAAAQQTNTEFGKNRVQFHDKFDEWLQYESENYLTYWYGEARNIGEAAVLIAEANYPEIQQLLEHQMSDKIELIVYTDLSDLKQSNIGATDAFEVEPDRVKVEGNKVFVYFDGDHDALERQIREGTASVILSSMMFGENLQEIVQNAVLLDIPLWYSEGLVAYVGEAWSPRADEDLRQWLLANPEGELLDLIDDRPRLAGHAWWNYVAQTYGRGTVGNLLYLTRISRSVESAIDYVYGLTFGEVADGWLAYHRDRLASDLAGRQDLDGLGREGARLGTDSLANDVAVAPAGAASSVLSGAFRNKHRARVTQLRLSPDGQRVAYVLNEIGKQQVFVEDLATGKRTRVMRVGYRNAIQAADYNYPLLAWHPDNVELGVVYESRDVLYLRRLRPGTNERALTEPLDPQLQRVYSIDYVNASQLVLAATVRGISDLFYYYPETRQSTRLTDDYYDDLDARRAVVAGRPGTMFRSNRPDTLLTRVQLDSVLPTGPMNLFFLADDRTDYPYLIRLTNTTTGDPRAGVALDSQRFAFLDERTGVRNVYVGTVEEYVAYREQVVTYRDGDVRHLPLDWRPAPGEDSLIASVVEAPVVRLRGVSAPRSDLAFGIDLLDKAARAPRVLALTQYPNGLHRYTQLRPDSLRARRVRRTAFASRGVPGAVIRPDLREVLPAWLGGQRREGAPAPAGEDLPDVPADARFQSPFEDPPALLPSAAAPAVDAVDEADEDFGLDLLRGADARGREAEAVPLHSFRPARIRAYNLRFRTDYVTTTFSNEPLFGGLDNFAATPQDFRQQPTGLLVKLNNKELFQDHVLELGARFATTFDNAEYYGYLDQRQGRIDRRYGLYHGTRRQTLPPERGSLLESRVRARSIIALTQWSYPFDVFSALRATATLRFDRLAPLLVNETSLDNRIDREQRAGLRLEYVYDNTLNYATNILHGSRAKVYAEVAKRFDVELAGEASFDFGRGLLTLVGADARHYFRVLRHGVFAVRGAAATTFGAERILFYLGGTDGAVASGFDQSVPVASGDFAYEMAITNLRGFRTNIRNGNSFVVGNAELRLPVFRYVLPHSRSNFLRQFQLVGFGDVGTAWTGRTPFTRENPINTVVYDDDPSYVLTVNYFRDPVVAGFGAGARVSLFGYFVRIDRAWGVETGAILDPRWHLSLGLDF